MRASFRAVVSLGISATMLAVPSGASLASAVVHAPRVVVPVSKGSPGGGHGHGGGPPGGGTTTFGWASSNWSGYAVSSNHRGAYTSVSGTWVVPSVTAPNGSNTGSYYSSSWVGIDGFNNSKLIQTGTEQDVVSGSTSYSAWWEILPAPETAISSTTDPVSPGDTMTATITQLSGSEWNITLTDSTKGWTFTTSQTYRGPGTSAEWIEEAPTVGGQIATLADYSSPTPFSQGHVNSSNPNLVTSDGGVMIQGGNQVSTPSKPSSSGNSFNMAYGSESPAAP